LKIASWFDPQIKIVLALVGGTISATNKKSKDLLGMKYEIDMK